MDKFLIIFWTLFLTISAQDFAKICKLPQEKGNCKDNIVTWFYDTKAGQCGVFLFSGCNGNANRFTTKAECDKYCAPKMMMLRDDSTVLAPAEPSLPSMDHDCSAASDSGTVCNGTDDAYNQTVQYRWYWNSEKFACLSFKFHGCGGNSNNFPSHHACAKRCQPMDGPVCLGGTENPSAMGQNCQNVTCPEGTICKRGAFYATCCNKTIENDSKCPDGSTIMQHPSSHFALSESCDHMKCPIGFQCSKGAMFARCCPTKKTGKSTSPLFS